MKQKISILVALIMLFNLSVGVFAQSVPGFRTGNGNYSPQFSQAKTATQPLVLAAEEQRREQEIVSYLGLNPTEYRKAIEAYAKAKKMDINTIDIATSYKIYSKEIIKYNNDYKALIRIFEGKTYNDVLTDANSFLGKKEDIVNYNGKKYNKVALFHAALHNFATRTKTGYLYNGTWVFKNGQETEFSVKEKVAVMDFIYKVISNDGFYPKDEEALYKMASEVVSNGKSYFKSTKQHKDETHDAKGVVSAITILTVLSNTSARKQESAQVIYDLSRKVMRKELGAMGILSGSQALLVLNTDDSLNKLYTLLAEDLYRGIGTELGLYLVETFSIEELQQRLAGFASEVNNGLGQYYNAIARRYVYVDPDKNSYDQKRLAEARDESLANYSKVIYTDIFEQIGKEIGRRTKDPKVAKLASRLATKYYTELNEAKQGKSNTIIGERADSPLKRETKIHASLIVGILSTAKVTSENLTKAAKVIYDGTWWDINEITQRDKNNIAASYLKLAKKPFNKRKQDMYALTIRTKNVAKFLDVYAQALMIGKMIVSMPAMIGRVSNWAKNAFKWFKVKIKPTAATNTGVAVKPVEVKPVTTKPATVKPAEVKPVEVKPIEVKPIEVKPLEMPTKAAPVEPVKLPSVAEPVKVPAAQVSQVAPKISVEEMATISKKVKWDILGKYYQRPAAMMIGPFIDLPFGLSGIGKNITFLLTNRHFLGKAKIEKVKAIVEEAALSVAEDINNGETWMSQSDATNLVKERALAKIQASEEFSAKDIESLTGRKPTGIVSAKQSLRNDLLTKYFRRPGNMVLNRFLSPIMGNPVVFRALNYSQSIKIYKVVDEAAAEIMQEVSAGNIAEGDIETALRQRVYAKIQESSNFTAEEKTALTGKEPAKEIEPSQAPKQEEYYQQRENIEQSLQEPADSGSADITEPSAQAAQGKVPANVKAEVIAKQKAKKLFKQYKKAFNESRWEESYDYINEAIEYDLKNAAYYHERAMLEYYNLDNKVAAIEDMKTAAKLNPGNRRYKVVLERWNKEIPGEVKNYMDLYKAAKAEGNNKLASEYLNKTLALDRDAATSYYNGIESHPKVSEVDSNIQKTTNKVQNDLLGQYGKKPLLMAAFPVNFFGVSERIMAFLTNSPYLSAANQAKVRVMVAEASAEVAGEIVADKIPESKMEAAVKERAIEKILKSRSLTVQEKFDITTSEVSNLSTQEKLANYIENIKKAEDLRDSRLALKYLQEAIKLDPNNVYLYNRSYHAHCSLGQYEKAMQDLDNLKKLEPSNPSHYANSFYLNYEHLHNFDQAWKDVNEVIRIKPEEPYYYRERAILAQRRGDIEQAMRDMKTSFKYNPNDDFCLNSLKSYIAKLSCGEAVRYNKMTAVDGEFGKVEKILDEYNRELSYWNKDRAEKAYKQALRAEEQGNIDKALQEIYHAISSNPYEAKYQELSYQLNYSTNPQRALENISDAIELDPINARYYAKRAEIEWYMFEDFESAISDMKTAAKYDSTYQKGLESFQNMYKEKIVNDVKKEILGPYNQTPLMASFVHMFLPGNIFKEIGKRLSCFLTNRPYLSSDKIAKVEAIIDETAAELSAEGIYTYDAHAAMKQRIIEKINNSSDFTTKEKEQLTNSYKNAGTNEKDVVVNNVFYFDGTVLTSISSEVRPVIPSNITPEVIAKQKATKSYKKFKKEYLRGNTKAALEHINEAISYNGENGDYYYERAMIRWSYFNNTTAAIEDMKLACKYSPNTNRYKVILDRWTNNVKTKEQKVPAKITMYPNRVAQARQARAAEAREAQRIAAENERIKAENARLREEAKKAKLAKQKEEIYKARMQAEANLKAEEELAIRKKNQEIYEKAKAKEEQLANYQEILEGKIEAGDYEGVIPYYTEVLKLEENATTYYQRAKAYLKTGQTDLAKADYKKGVELDPKNELREDSIFDGIKEELKLERGDKYSQKAQFFMDMGDNFQAIDELEMALRNDPKNAEYKALLKKAKESITAEEYYAKALEYKKHGKNQNTYEYFEKAISKATDKALKAQYLYEEARFLQYAKGTGSKMTIKTDGRYITYQQAALKSYDRAIRCAPTPEIKAQYLLERAKVKRINKDFEGAQADIEKAKKLDPNLK